MALGDAYLDKIEEKTGKTPMQFIPLAREKGYGDPTTKPVVIIAWLKEDFGLGHGYAMALMHFIKSAVGNE